MSSRAMLDRGLARRWEQDGGRIDPVGVSNGMDGDAAPEVRLLKPTDVARRLAVSRTWVYDAAKEGRIPSIRIGGEEGPLRFHPDDVESWVNDARTAWKPGCSAQPTVAVHPAQRATARTRRDA